MLAKLPFLFQLYKSGGGYVNGTIHIPEMHVDEPANSLTADFRNFRIFSYSLGRV
jgi:hypothetical protein